MDRKPITVETFVNAPIEKVWKFWTEPKHIDKWNRASEDWESRDSKNDVRTGGNFSTIMAAKDGSQSFEFGGTYTNVIPNKLIEYKLGDDRKVSIKFEEENGGVKVTETFDQETENSEELQRSGWQAILDSFKNYTENN